MAGTGFHWTKFYRDSQLPELPSQFALFVANEIATGDIRQPATILDIGCGNGRDSAFFSRQGYRVVGIDRSAEAIALCRARIAAADHVHPQAAQFVIGRFDDAQMWRETILPLLDGPLVVYARFVLHAITEAEEQLLLGHLVDLLKTFGGVLCIEARTIADRDAAKATPQHYRRFIETRALIERLSALALAVQWQAEGRGMAKYRRDDATVVRLVAVPR